MDHDAHFLGTIPATITVVMNTQAEAQFDTGWALLATLGMDIGGGWRMEGELGFRSNDLVLAIPTTFGSATKGGAFDEISAMGNWLLDLALNNSGSLKLSLGFGIGVDYAELKTDFGFDASEWSLAYQGIAGVSLALDVQTDVTLTFRHFRISEPEFEDVNVVPSHVRFDEIGKNSLTIGLRRDL
jgi:opacity protein-like surface antigen